ncbi:GNAT family N-acetyltransferase [Agrobacterium sp. CMT1]|jgi:putative acetyltransferase|uniref:GCN5-like N-acetyltransferase n=2 Tax=Hyphomicrobiales TaxID=356 RepID=U4Q8C1_9HYPH|nr:MULTISPECIES: GNAT family N-acetyltransferase [Agrobacterium]EKJ95334.1 GCN5-like N-acetyltransferase [Bradyrhizobium lupini HPC(L)]MBB2905323.1 putative acetyltransferase [Rhizobium sp. RAS22]MCW8279915.1 GNAT family N-acetyltransferase [Agrobacterium sp. InxBP2]MDR6189811.1 putative acetyltransferase [Agrobacterium pusense]NTE46693.1 GNAT family N-acetyltransferase [Agrobacterium pusense]
MKFEDVIIRPFEASDTVKLSNIWLEASLLAHPFIGERRLMEQKALIEEQYLPGAQTWVATLNGQAAGFISLLDTFIGGLFVSPCHQGLGIGRKLVSHALNLKGELSLEAYTENVQAMGFYRSLGFQELSRRAIDDEGYPFENARLRLVG